MVKPDFAIKKFSLEILQLLIEVLPMQILFQKDKILNNLN